MTQKLPPGGLNSLMLGKSVSAAAVSIMTADLYFDSDDVYYFGYDSSGDSNGRPREVRFTRLLNSQYDHAVGETPAETNGMVLRNTSAATEALDQFSPSIFLAGYSWESEGGTSQPVDFREEVQTTPTVAGGASGAWTWSASVGGSAYTKLLSLTSDGVLQIDLATGSGHLLWGTDSGGNIGAANANRPTNVYVSTSLNIGNGGFTASSSAVLGASGAAITIGDKNLLWTSDSGGNIGAAAANRPTNVYVSTSLNIGNGGFTASSSAVLGASGAAITIGDKNLLWTSDSGGNIGAAAANRPTNVYVATSLNIGNGSLALASSGTITASGGSVIIGDDHLIWTTDNTGDIGAAADTRPRSVYAGTSFNLSNGGAVISSADLSSGLGTTTNFTSSTDQELLISNTGRTMSAGNISIAINADLNSGSPTATHIICDVGYTDDSNVYQSQWSFQADGALVSSSTGSATVTGAVADGASAIVHTLDSSNAMSTAGSKLLSVQNNASEKFYIDKDGVAHAAVGLRVAGDEGTGLASAVTFTDVVDAAVDTAAVLGNWRVGSAAGTFHGWLKLYDGTTAMYVPTWT